jgi:hypothetical protein
MLLAFDQAVGGERLQADLRACGAGLDAAVHLTGAGAGVVHGLGRTIGHGDLLAMSSLVGA